MLTILICYQCCSPSSSTTKQETTKQQSTLFSMPKDDDAKKVGVATSLSGDAIKF